MGDVHAGDAPGGLLDPTDSWGTLGTHVVAAKGARGARVGGGVTVVSLWPGTFPEAFLSTPMPKILLLVVALAAGTNATICANDADFNSAANATMGDSTFTCASVDLLWSVSGGSTAEAMLAASDAQKCAAVSSSDFQMATIQTIAWAVAPACCGGADSACGAAPNVCANKADFVSTASVTIGGTPMTCQSVNMYWGQQRGAAASDAAACDAVPVNSTAVKTTAWAAASACCGSADASVCGAVPNMCANPASFISAATVTIGSDTMACQTMATYWVYTRGSVTSDAAACDTNVGEPGSSNLLKSTMWGVSAACCGGADASNCGAPPTTCDSLAACNGENPGAVGLSAACYQAVGTIMQSGPPASWAACEEGETAATVPIACKDAVCSELAACPGSKACSPPSPPPSPPPPSPLPPLPPPPSPPLPPAPAGMVYQSKVTFAAVVAGTVADFDQTAFKNNMASLLGGVDPADISLTVTAASVRVVSVFTTTNQATAATAAKTIATYDSTTISVALKVTVETVEAPTVAVEAVTAPPPSPSPPPGLEEEATTSGGGGRAQPSFLLAPFMLGLAGLLALA